MIHQFAFPKTSSLSPEVCDNDVTTGFRFIWSLASSLGTEHGVRAPVSLSSPKSNSFESQELMPPHSLFPNRSRTLYSSETLYEATSSFHLNTTVKTTRQLSGGIMVSIVDFESEESSHLNGTFGSSFAFTSPVGD